MNEEVEGQEISRGVVFAAIGKQYATECLRAVQSLALTTPELPVVVFTDHPEIFANNRVKTRRLADAKGSFCDKIAAMAESPFDLSLFLDADTVALEPIGGLFHLLSGFDLAVSLESYTPEDTHGLPPSFPEFNTGVILFRKSPASTRFLETWRDAYRHDKQSPTPPKHDQPSFRRALFRSELRFTPLSSRWNFRTCHPSVLDAGSTVAILHSRSNTDRLESRLKIAGAESRVFIPDAHALKPSRIGVLQTSGNVLLEILCWPIRGICFVQRKGAGGLKRFRSLNRRNLPPA